MGSWIRTDPHENLCGSETLAEIKSFKMHTSAKTLRKLSRLNAYRCQDLAETKSFKMHIGAKTLGAKSFKMHIGAKTLRKLSSETKLKNAYRCRDLGHYIFFV